MDRHLAGGVSFGFLKTTEGDSDMKRSSTTKKALFISTCALLFSMLMMAGSTFAWFTDSVSTGTNTITTGKLDVQLLHTNQYVRTAEEVGQNTLLFTDKMGNP